MTGADCRTLMLALRTWLDEDERNAGRIAEHILIRALAGHFGYFRFVLDTVDGPTRPTAEDETTGEADSVLVVADDGREAWVARAA